MTRYDAERDPVAAWYKQQQQAEWEASVPRSCLGAGMCQECGSPRHAGECEYDD